MYVYMPACLRCLCRQAGEEVGKLMWPALRDLEGAGEVKCAMPGDQCQRGSSMRARLDVARRAGACIGASLSLFSPSLFFCSAFCLFVPPSFSFFGDCRSGKAAPAGEGKSGDRRGPVRSQQARPRGLQQDHRSAPAGGGVSRPAAAGWRRSLAEAGRQSNLATPWVAWVWDAEARSPPGRGASSVMCRWASPPGLARQKQYTPCRTRQTVQEMR
ncbi:hypothetical protein GGR56DRAFT_84624 [Xylariaceae sp. FL0804]|nr:hypothetical protein GGR56DRAFT_84624 [Xylariaceae sp. FL0804]